MARGWNLGDILGIGNLTGNPDPIWGNLSGQNAIKDATAAQQAALEKAFNAIQEYTGKAIAQQQPYTQHAGEDFNRQRGLVQSGYFQTPYGQSFQPQQFRPNGFTMNPGQGMASFQPQSFQRNSYTPQGLPPVPNMPAYQPAPQAPQGGLMPPPQGQQMPPLQSQAPTNRGLMDQPIGDLFKTAGQGLLSSYRDTMFDPKDPLGMEGDRLKGKILNAQIPSTGNGLLDTAIKVLDPRAPLKIASDAGDTTKRVANRAVKKVLGWL
jgi:hypothetical protein